MNYRMGRGETATYRKMLGNWHRLREGTREPACGRGPKGGIKEVWRGVPIDGLLRGSLVCRSCWGYSWFGRGKVYFAKEST